MLESRKITGAASVRGFLGTDGGTRFGNFTKNENIYLAVQAGHTKVERRVEGHIVRPGLGPSGCFVPPRY